MIVEKCGRARCKHLFIRQDGSEVAGVMLCPSCAKLLDTLLQSRPFTGGLIIASLPLGERARLHRERAEEYARGEVA